MHMSPILVINGTEELLQVVIGNSQDILFHSSINAPGRTMKFLVPIIQDGLNRLELSLKDLSGIACTRGPGSFTGIRIVLATIEGMTRGCEIPVCGLEYLPILAADIPCHFSGEAWILTYARKTMVYIQGFAMPRAEPLAAARACTLNEAVTILQSRNVPLILHGSGLKKNVLFFQDRLPESSQILNKGCAPTPEGLLNAGLSGIFSNTPVTPLYIRHSDAEDNLASIARKRGISLQDALRQIPQFEIPCS